MVQPSPSSSFLFSTPPAPTKTLRVAFLQEGFEESPQSIRNYRQIMFAILKVCWLNLSREKNTGEGSEIIKAQIQSQHIKKFKQKEERNSQRDQLKISQESQEKDKNRSKTTKFP